MLPNLFLRVKPPEMGCHDRECSLPDIVDQGDRSMAVAARDEQPSAGHTCYRRATPHAGKTAMFSPVLRTLVPCRRPVGPHVHSEFPHWRGNRAPSPAEVASDRIPELLGEIEGPPDDAQPDDAQP